MLDNFIKKYEGKKIGYPKGHFVGECLSLVKWYIKECFNINPPPSGSNSAFGYWSNFPDPLGSVFKRVTRNDVSLPNRGDIIIWSTDVGNGFGHISIYLEGSLGSFRSFDQNWSGRQAHIQGHYWSNVVGWLTPIEQNTDIIDEDQMEITDQTVIPQIKSEQGTPMEVQAIRSQLYDNRKNIKNLKEQKEILETTNKTQKKNLEVVEKLVSELGFNSLPEMGEEYEELKAKTQGRWARIGIALDRILSRAKHDI